MFNSGELIDDRYRILDLIGQGGMAYVYRAEDTRMGRQVAVKVLKEDAASRRSAVADFRREARAAAGLSHPNIVAAYDIVDSGDIHYIVMELVEGVTLKNYIAQKGVLSNEETLSIAVQTASGIEAAHKSGIIHRDIKPHNIIISRDGRIKITDFGIALAGGRGRSRRSDVLGSVHYIAPEQARNGTADARSDIYSLGISMYEMITGRVPYDAEDTRNIIIAHMEDALVPPSVYNKDIYPALNDIIIKATRKAPEDRYQNIREMMDDLERAYKEPEGHFVRLFDETKASETVSGGDKVIRDFLRDDDDSGEAGGSNSADTNGAGDGQADGGSEENTAYPDVRNEDTGNAGGTALKPLPDRESGSAHGRGESPGPGRLPVIPLTIAAAALVFIICALFMLKRYGDRQAAIAGYEAVPETAEETEEETEGTDYTIDIAAAALVPELTGLSLEEAEEVLGELGLTIDSSFEDYSDIYAKGIVINQSPAAGDVFNDGATIYVTVSRGSRRTEVLDNLKGMSLAQAREVLEELGMDMSMVDERHEFSDEIHEGYVVGYEITLVPGKPVIPDTADSAGGDEDDGGSAADSNGDAGDDSTGNGSADGRTPEQGDGEVTGEGGDSEEGDISYNTAGEELITLIVSRGALSEYAVVPDVTGFMAEDAIEMLRNAGFGVNQIIASNNTEYDKDQIAGQSSPSDIYLRKGTLLDLLMSVGDSSDIPDGTVLYDAQTDEYYTDYNGNEKDEEGEGEYDDPEDTEDEDELDPDYYYGSIDTVCAIGTRQTGPISSGRTVMVGVRLRQSVEESVEYTSLAAPIPVEEGDVIPVVFTDIRGAYGVEEGYIEVYNPDTLTIYSSYLVYFDPVY